MRCTRVGRIFVCDVTSHARYGCCSHCKEAGLSDLCTTCVFFRSVDSVRSYYESIILPYASRLPLFCIFADCALAICVVSDCRLFVFADCALAICVVSDCRLFVFADCALATFVVSDCCLHAYTGLCADCPPLWIVLGLPFRGIVCRLPVGLCSDCQPE